MELWDIVRPSDLTRFTREVPVPQDLTLNRIFPDRTVNSIKARVETITRTLTAAKFRVYNAPNYVGKRGVAVSITDLTLPPVGQQLPLTERELLEMAISGQDPYGDVVAQVYDDATTNTRATYARMELARGDLLTDGKVSITENGIVGLEADFGLDATHKPTAAVLWTDTATSTPLSDEQAWIQTMVADGGGRPNVAVASLTVINNLLKNAEYRAAYWGGNAGSQPNLNRTQLDQVRADNGLPPIFEYDTQVDVDGTTTRVFPTTKFALVAPGAGETQWGLTAQGIALAANPSDVAFIRREAPGLVTAAYFEHEPPTRWTSTAAVGLPILFDKTKLLTATVG